jgi:hypothetical protein
VLDEWRDGHIRDGVIQRLDCSLLCLLDEGVLQAAAGLTIQYSDSLPGVIAVGGSKTQ